MKFFKKFAMVLVAVFALVLSLASCDNNTQTGPTVEAAAKRIILTQDKQIVSGDFQVPAIVKVDGVTFTVTWVSDNAIATITDKDENYKLVDEAVGDVVWCNGVAVLKDVTLKVGMHPANKNEHYAGGYVEDLSVVSYGNRVVLYNVFTNDNYNLNLIELEQSFNL